MRLVRVPAYMSTPQRRKSPHVQQYADTKYYPLFCCSLHSNIQGIEDKRDSNHARKRRYSNHGTFTNTQKWNVSSLIRLREECVPYPTKYVKSPHSLNTGVSSSYHATPSTQKLLSPTHNPSYTQRTHNAIVRNPETPVDVRMRSLFLSTVTWQCLPFACVQRQEPRAPARSDERL